MGQLEHRQQQPNRAQLIKKIVVPKGLRQTMLKSLHDSPTGPTSYTTGQECHQTSRTCREMQILPLTHRNAQHKQRKTKQTRETAPNATCGKDPTHGRKRTISSWQRQTHDTL